MDVQDKLFVVTMCLVLVSLTTNYAIMVTFFPLYAKARDISPYAVSMIFTSFSIANLLTSLISGSLASRFGRRAVLIWGVLQVSCAGCFIGYTPEVAGDDNVTAMCWLFVASRGLQGSGVALARQSIFAVLSDSFPDNRGLVVGSAISMIALGFMIGPPIGGLLYALSGFRLPFLFLSVLMLVCAAPLLVLWPDRRARKATDGSSTQRLAAADSAALADPAEAMMPSSSSPDGANTALPCEAPSVCPNAGAADAGSGRAAPSQQRPSQYQLLASLPVGVFVVGAINVVFESKWAMWDVFVVAWLVDEFDFAIPTASLHISIVAATFALGCPLGGLLGDRLGGHRLLLVLTLLGALCLLYFAVGPWQLRALSRGARQVALYFYLVADGAMSTLIEPQLMPEMLRLAEQQSRAGQSDHQPNEHLTNFVTAYGQFVMNAGAVIGPFVGVPIVERLGFRGALASWGGAYAVVAALTVLHMKAGVCCRLRPPSRRAPSRTVSVEAVGLRAAEAEDAVTDKIVT